MVSLQPALRGERRPADAATIAGAQSFYGPRPAVLYALGLVLRTSSGRIYPHSTFRRWLGEGGFEDVRRRHVPRPVSVHAHNRRATMKPAPLTEELDEYLFGGKAAPLAAATRAGLPVPAGVALPFGFVDAIAAGDREARQQLAAIFRTLAAPLVARSSAVGEDSEQATFAGQHLTRLNLRSERELVDAVFAIWDSARSPSALAYRERLRLPREPRMAVVVQELVDADSAGVLFSRNPITGSDELVIEAAWGLGESVVAGLVTPDRFRLRRDGAVVERIAGVKDVAVRIDPEGGTRQTEVLERLGHTLCLDDAQLEALHTLALRCDEVFDGSHDLEWAFAGDRLYLLQRRTLTATPTPAAGDHITDDSVRPPNEHGRSNRHRLQALPNLAGDTYAKEQE